jgi:hypothetical protein
MVGDVAWPSVVVVAIIFFRDPLKALIRNTKRFKGFGIDAEFNQQAQSVAIEAARIDVVSTVRGELTVGDTEVKSGLGEGKAEVTGEATGTVTPRSVQLEDALWGDKLRSVATSSPRAVVTEAWTHVEAEIARLARPFGQRTNALTMLRGLISAEIIPAAVGDVIQRLRMMRNEVAHNSELDPGEDGAIAYLDASINVVTVLKAIGN